MGTRFKLVLILSFFLSEKLTAQVERPCKMTDTVFVDNCILEAGEVRFGFVCNKLFSDEPFSDETLLLLDSLSLFMERNSDLGLIIECHTDSRGSDTMNMKLSAGRSNSIRQALARRGVDSLRIQAKGLGESQPAFVYLADGKHYPSGERLPEGAQIVELTEQYIASFHKTDKFTYEKLHQYNRRTVFRIVSADD